MTLTLYLVRHGQTLFNRRELVQGWVDSPLTERGWAQAEAVAAHLAPVALAAVYSSTSERAVDTAERIALPHQGLVVQALRGLKEMHFGELEARPYTEFFEQVTNPEAFFTAAVRGEGPGIGGGEPPRDYRARLDAALHKIVTAHPSGEVAIVSHGVSIAAILVAAGWDDRSPIENGSVSTVRLHPGDRWTVESVGVWQFAEDVGQVS